MVDSKIYSRFDIKKKGEYSKSGNIEIFIYKNLEFGDVILNLNNLLCDQKTHLQNYEIMERVDGYLFQSCCAENWVLDNFDYQ